ncbi:MAG: PrgI family protein [Patescibacteria group bacterium]|nr:PrgI family protein [Patescibacteria group bacterium]
MQFEVPQFIEVEDKIFGPLTLKQFIYLAGGAGISFTIYSLAPLFLAILIIIPLMGLSGALAFYKKDGRPFILTTESAFKYALGNKLYIWKKENKKRKKKKDKETSVIEQLNIPKLSNSKLKELGWSLDIQNEN